MLFSILQRGHFFSLSVWCVFFFFKQCLKATQLIGAFVNPAVSLKLILSDLERAPMASYLMILAAVIQGSPRKVLQPHLVTLSSALCNPEVSQRTEEVRRHTRTHQRNPELNTHRHLFQSVDLFSQVSPFDSRCTCCLSASCKVQSGTGPQDDRFILPSFRIRPRFQYGEVPGKMGSGVNPEARKS